MDYYKLKDSDIVFSGLALGTWGFSGAKLWGPNDDDESIRTIHQALARGITVFDTAERYGSGHAEEVLGKALKGRRDKAVICTKVRLAHHDEIVASCEQSLRRLGTDYIDVYQVHWPFKDVPMEETLGAYEELKASGKVREIGVCNFGPGALDMAEGHKIVTNQLPYSLIWRVIEKNGILEKCREKGISIWAYVPLAQGLLTGKYKWIDDVPLERRETRFYNSSWKQGRHSDTGFEDIIFPFINTLWGVCLETGFSMVDVAFAFLKAQDAVSSILVGARDRRQLEKNIESYGKSVPADVVERITRLSDPLKEAMGTNADLWQNDDGGRMF
jgi:aryl-alcohol dehydrogenase-like predicted oxidoreductase